jgi:hypothetical protein
MVPQSGTNEDDLFPDAEMASGRSSPLPSAVDVSSSDTSGDDSSPDALFNGNLNLASSAGDGAETSGSPPKHGRGKRVRKAREINLSQCLCGSSLTSLSPRVIKCNRNGCETEWVRTDDICLANVV